MRHDTATDEAIRDLVDAFYAKVRRDPQLEPIFETALHGRWDAHLPKMYDFWSSVMNTTGRYKGNPMTTHMRLPPFPPVLFDRWIALFSETARELCAPALAVEFDLKARRIAESLKLALYYRPAERDPLRVAAAPGT
ncbi:MAG TPA: group III truncated hemoglobin [Alphaproteobacteria bacterium]|nr:group III truncated hemoglobin [Alphaproteobacteria bacterium]